LDRIFAGQGVQLLTVKVVGDPPVSPAVMAGTFLDDIGRFLGQMQGADRGAACGFHGQERHSGGDAAYHDMAELFGFRGEGAAYDYHCPLAEPHDHHACLDAFSARLDHFFDGEHATRVTFFEPNGDFTATRPARTVYTGNYVCNREGLLHFIPFAPLKLRMAGPALGRILRAELGGRFVSANLPLLHTRTHQDAEPFEFRPGVDREAGAVDLSGEFERQFFGDVMLFTVQELLDAGYPERNPGAARIRSVLDAVDQRIDQKYQAQHTAIAARLGAAVARFEAAEAWWHGEPGLAGARESFRRFFHNMEANFGRRSGGLRRLRATENRAHRLQQMGSALAGYGADRDAWRALLGRLAGGQPAEREGPR
jgi:hypothetical protein